MIRLKITGVSRRASSEVGTVKFTYPEGSERTMEKYHGAEWEEVEFQLLEEDKPPIRVANIEGSAYLVNNVAKILLNDPALFGTFKVGDIIDFVSAPKAVEKTEQPLLKPASDTQSAPPPTETPKGDTTTVDNITIPKLV